KVSRATLKRYSAEFSWQARIADLDRKVEGLVVERQADSIIAMNERQALLGQAAQGIAISALEAIAEHPELLSPRDAIRLAKDGQHIGRRARGEATSRSEIEVRVYSELITAIERLWVEVIVLDDKAEMD